MRIAETEKYPHVTFFINGGQEVLLPGEERILVPSPKVLTYDSQPEMSAEKVTQELISALEKKEYGLIIVNYANPDMVGHTGNLKAAIKAVETVDRCVGKVVEAVLQYDGKMFLTADHGNCEVMFDEVNGVPHTAHTTNLVPTILINAPSEVTSLKSGKLADVAHHLRPNGIPKPMEMTGSSLLSKVSCSKFMLRYMPFIPFFYACLFFSVAVFTHTGLVQIKARSNSFYHYDTS